MTPHETASTGTPRAMPRASRGPPEVLLPTGRMSFLTTRGLSNRPSAGPLSLCLQEHRFESRLDPRHESPESLNSSKLLGQRG